MDKSQARWRVIIVNTDNVDQDEYDSEAYAPPLFLMLLLMMFSMVESCGSVQQITIYGYRIGDTERQYSL